MDRLALKSPPQGTHRDSAGHPQLVEAILDEIRCSGPMSFARFMDLALYHPIYGYYMRLDHKTDAEMPDQGLGEDRIGWTGDYVTNSDVSSVFAQTLARQTIQMDEQLGRPDPCTVVEMGAGKGIFARDFFNACRTMSPSLADRLLYVIIERSPAMQVSQQRALESCGLDPARVTWLSRLGELGTESVVGALFSNELVDAFPVHRIGIMNGTARELFVDYAEGRFCERWQPLSSRELQGYLERLTDVGVVLPDGARTDINLQAVEWMEDIARVLRRGFVMTVDYGHLAHDLYGPDRRGGTFLCYYHHMASDNPYERVGLQDMTAHVDFTTLACVGQAAGLHVAGFTNQTSFLIGLGVEGMLESMQPGSAAFQSVAQLLRPDGMGGTFKILIQRKGVDAQELDGLTFKPFFGSGLTERLIV